MKMVRDIIALCVTSDERISSDLVAKPLSKWTVQRLYAETTYNVHCAKAEAYARPQKDRQRILRMPSYNSSFNKHYLYSVC